MEPYSIIYFLVNTGYPDLFQLSWRAKFPTEDEGLKPNGKDINKIETGKSKEAEESLTLKWLAICVLWDYSNATVRF